jgi:dTDP-4-dehydrorhamnose reductase
MTCAGQTTWHGFAERIVRETVKLRIRQPKVVPICSADYQATARRPTNSRLDNFKLAQKFSVELPKWDLALASCLKEITGAALPARS